MRDRLIELIGSKVCEAYSPTCDEWQPHSCEKCFANSCRIGDLADHLLTNGVIVPPCKVGDTVWVVSQGQGMNMRWDVYEGKVSDIHINTHADLEIRAKNGEKFFGYYKPCFVFLTKEEAEKALAERSEK